MDGIRLRGPYSESRVLSKAYKAHTCSKKGYLWAEPGILCSKITDNSLVSQDCV